MSTLKHELHCADFLFSGLARCLEHYELHMWVATDGIEFLGYSALLLDNVDGCFSWEFLNIFISIIWCSSRTLKLQILIFIFIKLSSIFEITYVLSTQEIEVGRSYHLLDISLSNIVRPSLKNKQTKWGEYEMGYSWFGRTHDPSSQKSGNGGRRIRVQVILGYIGSLRLVWDTGDMKNTSRSCLSAT